MFGRKVAPGFSWALMFRGIFEKLNTEKNKFGLEDDYLYILLHRIVYINNNSICHKSAANLYCLLVNVSEDLKMTEFQRAYKGSVSIGKRISHIKEELEEVFDFKVEVGNHNVKYYTFEPKLKVTDPQYIEEQIEVEVEKNIPRETKGSQPLLFDRELQRKFTRAKMMELDDDKLVSSLLNKRKEGPLDPVEELLPGKKGKILNMMMRPKEEKLNSSEKED